MVETSIILPTFNRFQFLNETIASILGQSYGDFELIIVDDSDNDVIKEIVVGTDDPRIRYVHNGTRVGVSQARNVGIDHATGRFIAFIDDDDLWHDDYLMKMIDVISDNDATLAYCSYDIIDGVGEVKRKIVLAEPVSVYEGLLVRNFMCTSGVVIRRETIEITGKFDEGLPTNEDWDLWLRYAKIGPISMTPEVLIGVRRHGAQLSTKKDLMVHGKDIVVNRYIDEMPPKVVNEHLQWLAVNQFLYGDMEKGREYEDVLISRAPRSIKYRLTRLSFHLGRSFVRLTLRITGRYYDFL